MILKKNKPVEEELIKKVIDSVIHIKNHIGQLTLRPLKGMHISLKKAQYLEQWAKLIPVFGHFSDFNDFQSLFCKKKIPTYILYSNHPWKILVKT